LLTTVCEVLSQIRRAKTEAKTSQRTEVAHLTISATSPQLQLIESSMHDLRNAGGLNEVELLTHDHSAIAVQVRLAPTSSV
ncbi:MAG: hypothetical protein AAB088_07740, partial [Actinomycetota bacterium]